jgi:hypothetical protein
MLRYGRTTPTIVNAVGDILIGWFVIAPVTDAIDGELVGLKNWWCVVKPPQGNECRAWVAKIEPLFVAYLAVVTIFG